VTGDPERTDSHEPISLDSAVRSRPSRKILRLYHERHDLRTGALDARDEEECFTAAGRRVGVWLTTEVARGPSVFEAEVDLDAIVDFEVTAEDAEHRAFVIPGQLVSDLGFRAC
jgi:hypothetical protein